MVVKKLGADLNAYRPDAPSGPATNIFVRRIDCWHHTLALCKASVAPPARPSRKYVFDASAARPRVCAHSSIEMFDEDAIDCALRLAAAGRDPLVLNLSDDDFAGGCVFSGSGAQEESLFRRTNYCQTLTQDMYPIGRAAEAIYSPGVSVLKRSEADNWELVPETERALLSFVACPAIKYPITVKVDGERRLNEDDAAALAQKIRLIVHIAAANGHDAIVLGAMGCGAWNNPARHVAQIFRAVLRELDGAVPLYAFAIMTTSNDNYIVRDARADRHSAFAAFSDVFAQPEEE